MSKTSLLALFYFLKPYIPRRLQLIMRRKRARRIRSSHTTTWPINPTAAKTPTNWPGWPGNKRFAVSLTHDVEGPKGVGRVPTLIQLEKRLGFRSSFNFVGKDYHVPETLRAQIVEEGYEIGVHGLHHNGLMYTTRTTFEHHAKGINERLREWNAVGFRSPAMHRNLEWIHDLNILYDSSTFDTDPFEPQPDGVGTIFPFWHVNQDCTKAYVELPYTLPQDFCLFIVLEETDIVIWKEKIDWLADHGGLVLLDSHPDYMCFEQECQSEEEYPVHHYVELLQYIRDKYAGQYWHALPAEVSRYFASMCPAPINASETSSRIYPGLMDAKAGSKLH